MSVPTSSVLRNKFKYNKVKKKNKFNYILFEVFCLMFSGRNVCHKMEWGFQIKATKRIKNKKTTTYKFNSFKTFNNNSADRPKFIVLFRSRPLKNA